MSSSLTLHYSSCARIMIIVTVLSLGYLANTSTAFSFVAQQRAAVVAGRELCSQRPPFACGSPFQARCRSVRQQCFGGEVVALAAAQEEAGDIDLEQAMKNARANLKEGRSPGAGLESAFDQADAAFADLIVTSVDDQGIVLDDEVSVLRLHVSTFTITTDHNYTTLIEL